jgi:hypothetical protein
LEADLVKLCRLFPKLRQLRPQGGHRHRSPIVGEGWSEHPVIPGFNGEPVGHLARRLVDADKPPPPAAFLDALFIAHADHSLDQNYCTRRRGAPTSIRAEAMTVLLKLAI